MNNFVWYQATALNLLLILFSLSFCNITKSVYSSPVFKILELDYLHFPQFLHSLIECQLSPHDSRSSLSLLVGLSLYKFTRVFLFATKVSVVRVFRMEPWPAATAAARHCHCMFINYLEMCCLFRK